MEAFGVTGFKIKVKGAQGSRNCGEFHEFWEFEDYNNQVSGWIALVLSGNLKSASTILSCTQMVLFLQDSGMDRFRGLTLITQDLDTGFVVRLVDEDSVERGRFQHAHWMGGFGVGGFGFTLLRARVVKLAVG